MTVRRVILAGEHGGNLRGMSGPLERTGYDVASVDSPEILESFAAGTPPDLVIVDEAFGPDGGVAVCRTLRLNPFWKGVSLMLVVPAGEQHLEECLVSGINDFLLAPYPEEELLEKVNRLTVVPIRREVNTLARVREGREPGKSLLGKTLNVSPNGLLIEIESVLSIGRAFDVEFFLPDDPEPVRVSGRVIRRAVELDLFHPAYGIRFLQIGDGDRARIQAYVARRQGPAEESRAPGVPA